MSPPASATPAQRTLRTMIRTGRLKELRRKMEWCLKTSDLSDEPQCMALEGPTGAGKSTLVKDFARAYPRRETADGAIIPVLYVPMPSPATIKSVSLNMLEAFEDPAAQLRRKRGQAEPLIADKSAPHGYIDVRLRGYIAECRVRVVILDDIQHLIDRDTNRVLETVSDWLKTLIKLTGKPFIVVGIEGRVERILRSNPQLSRLFAVRETLRPYGWPHETDAFAKFIGQLEQGAGVAFAEELPRAELVYRLHYATDGVVGHVMSLIRFAALHAAEQGRQVLAAQDLAAGFDERLAKFFYTKANPFLAPAKARFVAPGAPSDI